VSGIHSRRLTGGAMTLASGVAVASLAFVSLPAPASAAAAATTANARHPAASAAATYLVGQLQGKHRNHYVTTSTFQGKTLRFVAYGESIDAAMSMDAAGVAQNAARRITAYIRRHVSAYAGTKHSGFFPGSIGKIMLLAEAQHAAVHHFGGTNLVRELISTEGQGDAKRGEYQQNPAGTPKAQEFFSTTSQALAMLALADLTNRKSHPDHAAQHFLIDQQCRDGGFPSQLLRHRRAACKAGSDIDSTGYAAQALLATGADAAVDEAIAFLLKSQDNNGGFGAEGGNANSTAIAVGALVATRTRLHGAIGWLKRHQVGCASHHPRRRGAVNFQHGYDPAASLRATSQAGVALAHESLAQVDRSGAVKRTPHFTC
jgi:hypothetical protein